MEGSFSTDLVHQWLTVLAGNAWVSLHYDNPGLGGVGAAEISGGSYARFKVTFTEPSNRSIWSDIDVKFNGLMQNQLTHFGIWNAAFGGTLQAYARLNEPVVVMDGGGYVIPVGELSLSIG